MILAWLVNYVTFKSVKKTLIKRPSLTSIIIRELASPVNFRG